MRFSAVIGSFAATAIAATALTTKASIILPDIFHTDRTYGGGYRSGGAKTLRHTGAGGAGMRRAWKRRRASGLL
jgi:hypothetical protein